MKTEMKTRDGVKRIAILGGGPSGLFVYKRLIESGREDIEIDVFEKGSQLGVGMPYSTIGAADEHVTNVSDNEIPQIVTSIHEWIYTAPKNLLERFNIDPDKFNEYKVLPRLLFGEYLSAQFDLLKDQAKENNITTNVHYNSKVVDIVDKPNENSVEVKLDDDSCYTFDSVIISTGHNWPIKYEGKIPSYYDSPYPPQKLSMVCNHTVGIKGSSLTAIDAVRTLSRSNGSFIKSASGKVTYQLASGSEDFKIVLHSRNGLLPAVRFHLDDSHLGNDKILTASEIEEHKAANEGFLSLDYLFENDFKEPIKTKDAAFYALVQHMNIEQFVDYMMEQREQADAFLLLKAEFAEAEKSIEKHQSIYWKEMLGVLSFAMNHPAKYLSAEDMIRLQTVLKPLISVVIAYVPQSSCIEMLALHAAGALDIVAVGEESYTEPSLDGGAIYHYKGIAEADKSVHFKTFVDCVGQPHLSFEDFPFQSMVADGTVSSAKVKFQSDERGEQALAEGNKDVEVAASGEYYLNVSGITINDCYQVVDGDGVANERIYMMAVPYIGGYNPDYSGLDFCEAASKYVVNGIFKEKSMSA